MVTFESRRSDQALPLLPLMSSAELGRSSLSFVECSALVRFDFCCVGDEDAGLLILIGAGAGIICRGGDCSKSGKVGSSRSESSKAEST